MADHGHQCVDFRGRRQPKRIAARYAAWQLDGAPEPSPVQSDLDELHFIQMFGVEAVYGPGPLPMETMRRLRVLRNLSSAWNSKNASKDWSEWIERNPGSEELIQWSILLAEKGDWPEGSKDDGKNATNDTHPGEKS